MKTYVVEYFYRSGSAVEISETEIKTFFNPYQIESVRRLENHIRNKNNYEKVIITFVKRKEG